IAQTAEALRKLVPASSPSDSEDVPDSRSQAARAELMPLITTMRDHVPALTRALSDSDGEVRILARRTLEDMTCTQLGLLERPASTGVQTSRFDTAPGQQEPILGGLQATVKKLAERMKDRDAHSRRTVIDVLEALGPAAAPAAPALVKALSDPDPFVRWAAARTLGKISPVAADRAVPALAGMLMDADLDLRVAAAAALERYGRAARTAVPDLIRALAATDVEMRVAVIHALGAIGRPEAQQAIP